MEFERDTAPFLVLRLQQITGELAQRALRSFPLRDVFVHGNPGLAMLRMIDRGSVSPAPESAAILPDILHLIAGLALSVQFIHDRSGDLFRLFPVDRIVYDRGRLTV